MSKRKIEKVTLIGAGLAGALLSSYLARRGLRVELFERRSDMRKIEMSAGRSINLALSLRGIHALREVGVEKEILAEAVPMRGRMMHAVDGTLTFQPYGKDDSQVINSVSRGGLNQKLMDLAESLGVEITFDQECIGVDFETGEVRFQDGQSKNARSVMSEIIIAADGSGSVVRDAMMKSGLVNFSQHALEHGYKELSIPAANGGGFRVKKNALHIWPRGGFMMIALPNIDGSFTCTLFLPFENGPNSFSALANERDVVRFFEKQFPDAIPHMPTLVEDFFSNPTSSLVTVRCSPWRVKDRVLLIGDSAHAIVPFYGQGMNCAFEDCTILNSCIETNKGNWEKAFSEYETNRKADADAIADLAEQNFVEMRDRVADEKFLMRKKLEIQLALRFPGVFVPQYSMVTFHRMSYAVAKSRGDIQNRVLDQICRETDSVESLDLDEVFSSVQTAIADT